MKIFYLILIAAISVFSLPVSACVQSITSTPEFVQLCATSDSCATIFYADLRTGSIKQRTEDVHQLLTDFLQTRQRLDSLTADDPDKGENPRVEFGERLFWSDDKGTRIDTLAAGATHITAQSCVIDAVTWDGTAFQLTIRRP